MGEGVKTGPGAAALRAPSTLDAASEHADPRLPSSSTPFTSLEALPPLLTVSEVAATLRTSRKAVYAMVERSQLPGITRIGRRLLVRRDDLVSFLDERRAPSRVGVGR